MTFKRRLTLYSYGFVLGIILSYFLLFRGRNRYSFFPNGRVLEYISTTKISIDSSQLCKLKCLHLTADSLKKLLLTTCDIQFSKSDKKRRPCPGYLILVGHRPNKFQINLTMCKKTSEITDIEKKGMKCDCN